MKKTLRLDRAPEDVILKLLKERFHIIKEVGSGLSGQVFLIQDQQKQLALKLLKPTQMNVSPKEALENFKREFSILKELNHPNIAKIVDFGHLSFGKDHQGKRYYFTSEFIEGVDLAHACHNQPFEVKEKLFIQVLRALNYLHSKNIYHFDIKPQNILVEMKNGIPSQAKLVDFGLASFQERENYRVGTPAYMAPEVIRGEKLNSATDIYSLGVTFYKILTGTNPFKGTDQKETCDLQLKVTAKPVSEINPEIPDYWSRIIKEMLEKKPADRYGQSFQILRNLKFLSGKNIEIETGDTKLSYLPEQGELVAREQAWSTFTDLFEKTFPETQCPDEKKPRQQLLIIEGEKGTGKTRFLNEMKHDIQLKYVLIYDDKPDLVLEELPKKFVLFIDKEDLGFDEVNTILQRILKQEQEKNFLLVWTTLSFKQKITFATTRISLENFNKEELTKYLNTVLKPEKPLPPYLIDEVFSRTQGNPFFVTEFTKSLFQQNILCDASGKWHDFQDIKIDFNEILAPQSMEEILKRHYQDTTPEEKKILDLFAVHGSDLAKEKIENILGQKSSAALSKLIENHLVKEHTSTCYFDNISLKEVILGLLPEEEKTAWHDLLATYFSSQTEKPHFLFHKARGSHFEESLAALLALGKIQMQEKKYKEALQNFSLYFEKVKTFQNTKSGFEAHMNLCECYEMIKEFEKAIRLHKDMLEKIRMSRNISHDVVIQILQHFIDLMIKVIPIEKDKDKNEKYRRDVQKYGEMALKFIEKNKLPLFYKLLLQNSLSYLKFIDAAETEKHAKKNLLSDIKKQLELSHKIWETLPQQDKIKVRNNRIIDLLLYQGNYEEAIDYCKTYITALEHTGHDFNLAYFYYCLANIYYNMLIQKTSDPLDDLFQKSAFYFQKCLEIAQKGNHYDYLQRARNGLGNLCVARKNQKEALDYYESSLNVCRKNKELATAGYIAYNIANIATNKRDKLSYLTYAINTFEGVPRLDLSSQKHLILSTLSLCEFFMDEGQLDQAERYLKSAEEIFQKNSEVKKLEYWLISRKALLSFLQGNPDSSRNLFQKAETLAKDHDEEEDFRMISEKIHIQ